MRDVDSILGVTLNKTESESSYINSELHRKIVAIKKKNGANFFHVRRYSGEPTMNPRNIERKYEESQSILPPPKALYPLHTVKNPKERPEANNAI